MYPNRPGKDKTASYSIVVVCDFPSGLTSRLLDVYRFFREPPRIVLIRRGRKFQANRRLSVDSRTVPLPVITLERAGLSRTLLAISVAIGYLLYSVFSYARINPRVLNVRLVHAHYIFPQGLLGLILARLWGLPIIVTASGTDVNFMMRSSGLLRIICLFVLRQADVAIAVSKPLQQNLSQLGVTNSIYVPNSIDTDSIPQVDQFNSADSILFVGSMTVNKRPLVLLEAFHRIAEQIPSATLLMCGNGPLAHSVRKEIQERGLQNRVTLVPIISPQRLNNVRSQIPVFVLPSAFEGLSLALLEALAAGQMVIASRNESHCAVLEHRKTGLLFEVDNQEQLFQQILLALTERRLRSRIGHTGRKLCEAQFSSAIVARQLEDQYLMSMASHRLGSKSPGRRSHEIGTSRVSCCLPRKPSNVM